MPNLLHSVKGWKWWPDADAVNAPDGALLLADNLIPDEEAQLALRPGSSLVYSGLRNKVHSEYGCPLNGQLFGFSGADDRVYRNGVDFGTPFMGDGDIAMGDDAYQVFFARGTTKKKFDGTTFNNWPIAAPEFPATLSALTAITATVASFDSSESPAFVVNEGTSAFVAGFDSTANGALKLIPAASGRASASKIYAADTDLFSISGSDGGDTDLFDIYVWIEEPTVVDKITIMFGVTNNADPFRDDYYYFDFQIKDPGTVNVKDPGSASAAAFSIIANKTQSVLTPSEVTDIKTPEQVVAVLTRLGRFAGPRSRERADSQQNSPAWTHLSVTRGQFNRVGGTAGRDWQTVKGFKIVYTATPGSTQVLQCDSAVFAGGGDRSLTGKYQLGYRFVRNFNDVYQELSPISPISDQIELTQQAMQVTIPSASLAGKDSQVNEIWVYLTGGFLDTYYRFARVSASVQQGMTIDELTNPAGSNFNTAGERTRLSSWGFTRIAGDTSATDLVFSIRKSELEALIENESLEPGCVGTPDNIVAIIGPFHGRMFVLTSDGRLYPSSQDNPSSYSLYQHLDLRKYGTPLWGVLTSGGIYIGMSKDIIHIGGTGNESDDHISADLFPEPLHVGNPPVGVGTVGTDGNSVIYRSMDGPMLLSGVSLVPVPAAGTDLLWRGQNRHGIQPLNTVYGRYKFAIDNHIVFMLAPEGDSYTPPLLSAEQVSWGNLTGLTISNGVFTKTAANGYGSTTATATKRLESGDGYIEVVATETNTARAFGLTTTVDSSGDLTKIDYALVLGSDGQLTVYENGVQVAAPAPYVTGDILRVECASRLIYYKKNGVILYISIVSAVLPLVADTAFNNNGATLGPITIFGNWLLIANSTDVIWRYSLSKQLWSRTIYPVNFMSLYRNLSGQLLAGTDGGQVWELDSGTQDDGADIAINLLTPIDDGSNPLARKDALDFQIHANTGGQAGTTSFYLDGSTTVTGTFPFSCLNPDVFRTNVLALGVFLKVQLRIQGSFNRFFLHAFALQYRNRVQQVMVLDTGTISPQGLNSIVWMAEGDIDCISPSDLVVDIYLDDTLKSTQPVVVIPNKRSIYRVPFPRGCKARAPRLVFRTTAADGVGNPGFEPYRVRIRDRGTGTVTGDEFRPIWPVGTAP